MVPKASVFFDEVREACAHTASILSLIGPHQTEEIIPVATYQGAGVEYRIHLDTMEGIVECSVETETDSVRLTVDIEELALATRAVERRGGFSRSARNLKQMKKSLLGQAEYVRLVHPFLANKATEELMRQAGAREWDKRPDT
jgi:hypothetical protein